MIFLNIKSFCVNNAWKFPKIENLILLILAIECGEGNKTNRSFNGEKISNRESLLQNQREKVFKKINLQDSASKEFEKTEKNNKYQILKFNCEKNENDIKEKDIFLQDFHENFSEFTKENTETQKSTINLFFEEIMPDKGNQNIQKVKIYYRTFLKKVNKYFLSENVESIITILKNISGNKDFYDFLYINPKVLFFTELKLRILSIESYFKKNDLLANNYFFFEFISKIPNSLVYNEKYEDLDAIVQSLRKNKDVKNTIFKILYDKYKKNINNVDIWTYSKNYMPYDSCFSCNYFLEEAIDNNNLELLEIITNSIEFSFSILINNLKNLKIEKYEYLKKIKQDEDVYKIFYDNKTAKILQDNNVRSHEENPSKISAYQLEIDFFYQLNCKIDEIWHIHKLENLQKLYKEEKAFLSSKIISFVYEFKNIMNITTINKKFTDSDEERIILKIKIKKNYTGKIFNIHFIADLYEKFMNKLVQEKINSDFEFFFHEIKIRRVKSSIKSIISEIHDKITYDHSDKDYFDYFVIINQTNIEFLSEEHIHIFKEFLFQPSLLNNYIKCLIIDLKTKEFKTFLKKEKRYNSIEMNDNLTENINKDRDSSITIKNNFRDENFKSQKFLKGTDKYGENIQKISYNIVYQEENSLGENKFYSYSIKLGSILNLGCIKYHVIKKFECLLPVFHMVNYMDYKSSDNYYKSKIECNDSYYIKFYNETIINSIRNTYDSSIAIKPFYELCDKYIHEIFISKNYKDERKKISEEYSISLDKLELESAQVELLINEIKKRYIEYKGICEDQRLIFKILLESIEDSIKIYKEYMKKKNVQFLKNLIQIETSYYKNIKKLNENINMNINWTELLKKAEKDTEINKKIEKQLFMNIQMHNETINFVEHMIKGYLCCKTGKDLSEKTNNIITISSQTLYLLGSSTTELFDIRENFAYGDYLKLILCKYSFNPEVYSESRFFKCLVNRDSEILTREEMKRKEKKENIKIHNINQSKNIFNILNEIPGIENHDFYKNELKRYTFLEEDKNLYCSEILGLDFGIFSIYKISNNETLYSCIRKCVARQINIELILSDIKIKFEEYFQAQGEFNKISLSIIKDKLLNMIKIFEETIGEYHNNNRTITIDKIKKNTKKEKKYGEFKNQLLLYIDVQIKILIPSSKKSLIEKMLKSLKKIICESENQEYILTVFFKKEEQMKNCF